MNSYFFQDSKQVQAYDIVAVHPTSEETFGVCQSWNQISSMHFQVINKSNINIF